MTIPTMNTLRSIYPLMIQQYETFIPNIEGMDITQKTNSIIQYLNRIGKLNNDVVADWNKVMKWVLDEGLQDATNTKVDDLIAKGTFDDLLQAMFDEINTANTNFQNTINGQVNTLTTQMAEKAKQTDLDVMKANSKYMLVYFCDTAYRQGTDYFTSFATNGKNAGFKEINILLHINSDGTTLEDITKFSQYSSIADGLGIPITCLKVHGTYSYPNYLTKLYSALAQLPHINTVFVFNEQFSSVFANGLTYPSQIKTAYPNVTKVGCTVDYGTAFKSWSDSASNLTAIQNNYDILGVHMYPSCGSFTDAKDTTYKQCLNAFNEFPLTIPWEKELWLTESGVLPYWQFLELPESYSLTPLTEQTKTIDPQRLFYRALFNSNMANKAKVVVPWYTESWMDSTTTDMWNVMKNIIRNN